MNETSTSVVAVVDDDESVCRSFGRLLRLSGFKPITYHSAEAFLDDPDRPELDCLVLDIQLGGMSGLDLRNRLAAVHDETPVIFITARDDPGIRAQAEAGGCLGFFRKTDPGALIFESIEKAVRQCHRGTKPVSGGESMELPCS